MKYNAEDFAKRLRDERKKKRLTQSHLEKKLGLSHGVISKYEKQITSPSIDTLANMALEFHVSSDYLLFGCERSDYPHLKHILRGFDKEKTDKFFKIMSELFDLFRSLK